MAANGEINFFLNAKGNALAVLKALQSQLANFSTTFAAGFNLNFGAQTANFLLSLPSRVSAIAQSALALAGSLKDQSEALGVSTDALQVYRFAIENAGGQAELFDKAVATSNRSLVEARVSSGTAADAYRFLGLSISRLSALPAEERLLAISRAVQASADPLKAFSAAGQILGTKNLSTLLNALKDVTAKGLTPFAAELSRMGILLDNATIKRLDAAEKAIKRFQLRTTVAVGEGVAGAAAVLDSLQTNRVATAKAVFEAIIAQVRGPQAQQEAALKLALLVSKTQPPKVAEKAETKVELATKELVIKSQLAALDRQRAAIEGNGLTSEIDKREAVVEVLDRQAKLLNDLKKIRSDGVNLSAADATLTEGQLSQVNEIRDIEAKILAIRQEAATLGGIVPGRVEQSRRAAAGVNDPLQNPRAVRVGDAAEVGVNDFLSSGGSSGQQIAETITGTIGTAAQGVSDVILGWATGANNFIDVLKNVGLSVAQQMLDTLINIGVQQVLNGNAAKAIALGWKALTSGLRAADTTETIAAEATKTPILATNAALASASSFGVGAVIGIAALALALGAFIAGFEQGGYTGAGPANKPAGIVHAGEYVLTQAEVNRLGIGRIEAFKGSRGYQTGGFVTGEGASASQGQSGNRPIQLIAVDSRREANRIAKNSEAESQIFDYIYNRRAELLG